MTVKRTPPDQRVGLEIGSAAESWLAHLRAANLSPKTIGTYSESVHKLEAFLVGQGMPSQVTSITREHVEAFIADQLSRNAPATASIRYRALFQFWKWLREEGEVTASPMANTRPPVVAETRKRILSVDEKRRLLATTDGRTFEQRRDRAILSLFMDTGARLSEIGNLKLEDVAHDVQTIEVTGKGSRIRRMRFGNQTAKDIDRYLRLRRAHPFEYKANMWLSAKGAFSVGGIAQMIRRRAKDAGLKGVHPHAFRHTFAHDLKSAGASDEDVMMLGGWRSATAMRGYGRTLAEQRAMQTHERLSPRDQL